MAEGKPKKNVSHEMIIWKKLIETELKTAANWEYQWGFLKADQSKRRLSGCASAPSLGAPKVVKKLDRSQALLSRVLERPQQRYGRPMITSHEIGWREKSLERFGVSQHGIKRDPGIWPDY